MKCWRGIVNDFIRYGTSKYSHIGIQLGNFALTGTLDLAFTVFAAVKLAAKLFKNVNKFCWTLFSKHQC